MKNTTKIITEVNKEEFKIIVQKYKNKLTISTHALDHLETSQRNMFFEEDLFHILINENPEGVGLQKNGRYAAFYKKKRYFIKIILEIKKSKIEIITFINTKNIINFKRLKNE